MGPTAQQLDQYDLSQGAGLGLCVSNKERGNKIVLERDETMFMGMILCKVRFLARHNNRVTRVWVVRCMMTMYECMTEALDKRLENSLSQ